MDLFRKIRNNKKIIYGLVAILWLAFTILVVNTLRHPNQIVKEINENNIVQETTFNYKADIVPYSLNPRGGIVDIEGSIFTKITKDVILHINTSIKADKPIRISGTKKVILTVIAEDLWEKEYLLERETSFNMEGTDNKIIDDDYAINLQELTSFMKIVEEEIGTRPSRYIFEIKPIINGKIIDNEKEIPIDQEPKTFVDYSQNQMMVSMDNIFTKTIPINTYLTISQKLDILGLEVAVKTAKYIFTSTYIILLIALITLASLKIKKNKLKLSEVQIIDKKYKARLINVVQAVNKLDRDQVILDSFKSLLIISDERDTPIFRYEYDGKVSYYIINEGYVFVYEIDKTYVENVNLQTNFSL